MILECEEESISLVNEETVVEKNADYKIVNGDNGKQYIVFINHQFPNFTVAVNYAYYKKFGLKGFPFNKANSTMDGVKFVHGEGKDYIVLHNTQNPKYTVAFNLKKFEKAGCSLKGFSFKDGLVTKNAAPSKKGQFNY